MIKTVSYGDYAEDLKAVTDALSNDNSKYVLGETDKLQLDILVRLIVERHVSKHTMTEPITIKLDKLLTIKLNMLTISGVEKYVYEYTLN